MMRSRAIAAAMLLAALPAPFLSAGESPPENPPRVIAAGPNPVGRCEIFEVRILVEGLRRPFEDGRIAAVFMDSEGRSTTVRGFYARDFDRRDEGGAEALAPRGVPYHAVRFAPRRIGTHRYRVDLERDGEIVTVADGRFEAVPSGKAGFIRVHRDDPRFFQYETGGFFLPLGRNVAWATARGRTFDFDRSFGKLAAGGGNCARVWMPSWDMAIENERLGEYDLANAWRLDHVFAEAERRGVAVILVVDNFWDLAVDPRGPYRAENGGPCATPSDYFTSAVARAFTRRRIDYLTARYGARTGLFAWELMNEADLALTPEERANPRMARALADWTRAMAGWLKSRDPGGHPVTTSLGPGVAGDDIWSLPEMDFVSVHAYLPAPPGKPASHEQDEASFVEHALGIVGGAGKPRLLAEYGYSGSGSTSLLNAKDPEGIHLHNALWATALSGAAGAAMPWWWDSYIEPNGLDRLLAPLARFLAGEDFARDGLRPVRNDSAERVRVLGLQGARRGLYGLFDREAAWHPRIVGGNPPVPVRGLDVEIPGLENGDWMVEWWNPATGEATGRGVAAATKGVLTLAAPEFTGDIAVKVEWRGPGAVRP
ncbi:MAG: DUF5060 domain-containing protein [Planctomycetota bacterium]